ncbi:ATP-binding cassette domain-containing protein [bacterium]|nr:ATP-binding cassette domain-containing protein [candidate division CSSED10-310 bacterium]
MIRLENISKSFGNIRIFEDLNLHVRERETTVIFGPSAMGKTLLVKLCLGLIRPDSGRITIDGERIDTMPEDDKIQMRLKTGTLFQNNALFDSLTVAQNVGFYLSNHSRMTPEEIMDKVVSELKLVNLEDSEHLKPAELSGGMQKRVGIARATVHRPKILFYDAPTDGLDPVTADTIMDLIKDLNKRLGTTTLIISNDMNTAFRLATHMGMLIHRRIHIYGTPEEIASSRDPYVYQFIRGLEKGPILDDQEMVHRSR